MSNLTVIVDQDIQLTDLVADASRCGVNRDLIRYIELACDGARPHLARRSLTTVEVARPDKHSEAMRQKGPPSDGARQKLGAEYFRSLLVPYPFQARGGHRASNP